MAKAAAAANAVTTTDQKSNAIAVYDYGDDASAGFEGTTKDDYSIPFIAVLQALSPQVELLDSAKAGMIINTVTNDLVKGDEGVLFIPCITKHQFIEWVPRDKGGGFVAAHELDSPLVKSIKEGGGFGKVVLDNGNELIETFYVFGVKLNADGSGEQAMIAFTSTKIKAYKQWLTKARAIQIALPTGRRITPPLFAHVYKLTTVKQKNNKGEFYNWNAAFNGPDAASCRLAPDSEAYQSARAVKEMVESGQAKVDHSQGAATGGDVSDEGGGEGGTGNGKVPF